MEKCNGNNFQEQGDVQGCSNDRGIKLMSPMWLQIVSWGGDTKLLHSAEKSAFTQGRVKALP